MTTVRHALLGAALVTTTALGLAGCSSGEEPIDAAENGASADDADAAPVPGALVLPAADRLGDLVPEPVDAIAEGARVVTIGEATHGAHEFFAIKADLIRHLVSTGAVDTVLLEDGVAEVAPASRYVAGQAADPAVATADLLALWQSTELLDLIDWLAAHNESAAEPVALYGLDIPQYGSVGTASLVLDSLAGLDPDLAAVATERLACLADVEEPTQYAARPVEEQDACGAAIAELSDLLAERFTGLHELDPTAAELAWLGTTALFGAEETYRLALAEDATGGVNARERGMAAVTAAAVDAPMAATPAVWAHNIHAGTFTDLASLGITLDRSLTALLSDRYGPDAVATIGFSFETGGFHAFGGGSGLEVFTAGAPPADGVAEVLTGGSATFLVATADVPDLAEVRPWRTGIGGGYDPADPDSYLVEVAVQDAFDVLVHVPTTTPSQIADPALLAQPAVGVVEISEVPLDVTRACPDGEQLVLEVAPGELRVPAQSTVDGTVELLAAGVEPLSTPGLTVEFDGGGYRAEGELLTPDDPTVPLPLRIEVPDLAAACPQQP